MTTTPSVSLDITPTLTLVDDDTNVNIKQTLEKDVKVKPQMIEIQSAAERQGDPQQSRLRKMLILAVLCSAQFFDIFSSVEAVIALPEVISHHSYGILPFLISLCPSRSVTLFTSHQESYHGWYQLTLSPSLHSNSLVVAFRIFGTPSRFSCSATRLWESSVYCAP